MDDGGHIDAAVFDVASCQGQYVSGPCSGELETTWRVSLKIEKAYEVLP